MRVIQTKNDTIRLIFNPKTDGLCLSDFLIVRDGEDNFLGQIIEIYDDKFNAEENVATIRLVYRILPDQQVVPYDNFTPSRECEIARIKIEEIEKCVNVEKETVPFGISAKNDKIVNITLDFFNNNPVVFADKLDEVNCAFENIAQKLKSHKKVVAIDYTGNLNIKNAKRIKAIKDFKLPLDFYSLDYIWEKSLGHATLDIQTELEDTLIELKEFANSTEDKFIPFPRFIKVLEQQYKATPVLGLKMLLNKLKRFWNEDLFSRSKKEFQAIAKTVAKEDAVIIDLSSLKLEWHKDFLEFVIRQIQDTDAYLLLRLNENNSNPEIINDLYLNNKKLSIISSVSYGYAKLPYLMEHIKNYILYKTLNPRRDFGFANPQIAALNSSSFLIFGEDTKDFMFALKNYVFDEEELEKFEDKKIYIDLNLELEEMTSVELAGGDFELKNIHIQTNPKSRLSDEVTLDEVMPEVVDDAEKKTEEVRMEDVPLANEDSFDNVNTDAEENSEKELPYTLEEIDDSTRGIIPDIVSNHLEVAVNDAMSNPDEALEESSDVAELIEASLKNDEEYIKEIEKDEILEETQDVSSAEIPVAEDDLDYFINPDESDDKFSDENKDVSNVVADVITSDMIENAAINEELNAEINKEFTEAQTEDEAIQDVPAEMHEQEASKELSQNPKEAIIIVEEKPILKIDDFTENEKTDKSANVSDTEESKEDDDSLKELAQKSIEARFEEVIGETKRSDTSKNQLKINENVSIDLNKIKNQVQSAETPLPIFDNSEADEEPYEYEFEDGMRVVHQKYGAGSILKVVKYSNRCLLQIEFDDSGKRLLDPKIAKIKPE